MAKVEITVTPGPSVTTTSINIDGSPVPLVNNKGALTLAAGRHILVWHFGGNPGETMGIAVEAEGTSVLTIKKSRVPAGENAGAGIERFEI